MQINAAQSNNRNRNGKENEKNTNYKLQSRKYTAV